MNSLEVVSPLTPGECAARLAAAIDHEGIAALFGSKPAVGRVAGHRVRLQKRTEFHNSFKTFLVGIFDPMDGGTVFRGTFGMHPFVRGFLAVVFGVVAVVGGGLAVAGLAGRLDKKAARAAVVAPPLALVVGAAGVAFGRYLARGEAEFLAEFVAATLDPRARVRSRRPGNM